MERLLENAKIRFIPPCSCSIASEARMVLYKCFRVGNSFTEPGFTTNADNDMVEYFCEVEFAFTINQVSCIELKSIRVALSIVSKRTYPAGL